VKVVQINGSYGNADSTGRTCKEMHMWLKAHGHQSIVYAVVDNEGECCDSDVHFFSSKTDRKIHAAASRITGLQGYFSKRITERLVTELDKLQPDVVICRVLHNNSVNFKILCDFFSENNIPVILVLHDCWYFTGHCCYYTTVNCKKWQQGCECCPQIHDWNTSWWFDTAHKCLEDKKSWFSAIPSLGVVGVSDWITGEAEKSILKDAKFIKRVYNWIDLEVFHPLDTSQLRIELGIAPEHPIMLGVASGWSNQKGLAEILALAERHPECAVILIGNMPSDVQLPANVQCIGTIKNPHQLAQFYSMSDVFLNPTKQETFGKTTAEAICCGTPVVAYDTTACTELVGPSGCGEIVPYEDAEAFYGAVDRLLKNGKAAYHDICLSFARENFDKEKNIQEYMKLFEQITGR
jgi:glycosyltransferase involved in cell wall biosynthesis